MFLSFDWLFVLCVCVFTPKITKPKNVKSVWSAKILFSFTFYARNCVIECVLSGCVRIESSEYFECSSEIYNSNFLQILVIYNSFLLHQFMRWLFKLICLFFLFCRFNEKALVVVTFWYILYIVIWREGAHIGRGGRHTVIPTDFREISLQITQFARFDLSHGHIEFALTLTRIQ